MPHDTNDTIASFLNATAAKQPVPGGGSVTALCGALAVALGEMVLRYSVDKKDLAEHRPALDDALKQFGEARKMLSELMIEDQSAFELLTANKKLPPDHPDRDKAVDMAVMACVLIPKAMGSAAFLILVLCESLVDKVNPYLLSDLAVCAELSVATVRCAAYNVRANLPEMTDAKMREATAADCAKQIAACGPRIREIIAGIWKREGFSS